MKKTEWWLIGILVVFILSLSSTVWSAADDRRGTDMISGTITKIDGDNVTIKDGAGKLSTFRLPEAQTDQKVFPKVEAAGKVFPKVEAAPPRLKVGDKIKAQVQGKNIKGMELAR